MITGNEPLMPLDYDLVDTSRRGMATGLTIRQHLAAIAMQGMLSNNRIIDSDNWEWVAENAVKQSDALIAELNKTEK